MHTACRKGSGGCCFAFVMANRERPDLRDHSLEHRLKVSYCIDNCVLLVQPSRPGDRGSGILAA